MKKTIATTVLILSSCASSQTKAPTCQTGNAPQDKICRAEVACGKYKSNSGMLDFITAGTNGTKAHREKCIDRHIAADSEK